MRVLEKGHKYVLANKCEGEQVLTFFRDLPKGSHKNHDGVLTQEVLRAVIDRTIELHSQVPCSETSCMIELLRECIILGKTRAARRSLEKCYSKTGLHVEQLPVKNNGHVFDMEARNE